MPLLDTLERPTLLLNTEIARQNIQFMTDKARQQGVRFRPHFKTHQSAAVGEWFRDAGISTITVSSVDMALYFADNGWTDITIAFPLNIRQMRTVNALAQRIRLGVLVESAETVKALQTNLDAPVDVWIKIDSGNGRTGLAWSQPPAILALAQSIQQNKNTRLRGLLTHAGHTYTSSSREEIVERYQSSVNRMSTLQTDLWASGLGLLEVSVGDTPGCTVSSSFGKVDEIRPGNFVFYDSQMLRLGVCTPQQIAVALACPVVARHPERGELVVYGGAVHLSKDTVVDQGMPHYGYVVQFNRDVSWSAPLPDARVARLSQEHGVIALPPAQMDLFEIGSLIGVLPAHSCLTVAAMRSYRTLDGEAILTDSSTAPA